MCRLSHRIPAFSLVEILVVMVLSSIMVGIIYFTYYTVSTYQMQLMRKQQTTEDVSALYFLLKRDIDKSRLVIAKQNDVVSCVGESNTVTYVFDSLVVLRTQQDRIDTFHCELNNLVLSFDKIPLANYPDTIDGVSGEVASVAVPVAIRILKHYDAASLINISKKDTLQ